MQERQEQFFTKAEVAQRLRVSAISVHRWIKRGKLGCHRFGRRVLISAAQLEAFCAASAQLWGTEVPAT